jgi:arabinose-5-phosphate isomerase
MIETARRVIEEEAEAVRELAERLNADFERAVDLIVSAHGNTIVVGVGKSGHVARKVAATLTSTGTPAVFLHPAEGVHGDLGLVQRGDVAVAFSRSGETEELSRILPAFARLDVQIVAVVGRTDSPLARSAEVVLDASVDHEAGHFPRVPTSSSTAAMVLGDALAVAVADKRGFTEEEFALLHPGGAIGRSFVLRVRDLMHTGEEIPIVREDADIREALFEITGKRLGMTAVVAEDGRLSGVFTDGDLRRAIERGDDALGYPIHEAMSASPKTIPEDALALSALSIMERHAITALVVCDEDERPCGVLHLHDILRAGVV